MAICVKTSLLAILLGTILAGCSSVPATAAARQSVESACCELQFFQFRS